MLKYILALFVIALGWAAVLVLEVPMWIGIVSTAVPVLVVAAIVIWRRAQSAKAAKEIEKSLAKQAAAFAQNARPDQQGDIEAMQAEFNKAVRALKSSRLARKGHDAMAALPWYMIIGPPGAGKSTALKASGLQFPYLSSRGGGVRGVGGTRNCDWWLTNEAILLDTAGRYATEDDDQEEWFAFLDMLKRTRARRPINGVLVAVNVAELGGASEEEVAELAKRIRDRVDEVMSHLHVVVPVYLLCTKCDLVPGFVETWSELKKNDRGQIWGFTLPLEPDNPEPGEAFADKFDELLKVVEQRSLSRMAADRRVEIRQKVYEFPQQMAALRQNLIEFTAQAFAGNVYQETPILRGVYFTSGTQEGRPIDRVMSKVSEAFGVRPRVAQVQAPGEARSYFLRDVFSKVIFPDRDVAAASGAMSRRDLMVRAALVGGVALLALLLLLLPTASYVKNGRLISATRAVSEALASAAPSRPGGPLADEVFEPLGQEIDLVSGVAQDGPGLLMRFGMYQGDVILPPLARVVRDTLVKPLTDEFEHGQAADRSYDALKLYLLLSQPKPDAEPQPSGEWKAARTWMINGVRDQWARRASGGLSTPGRKAIEKLVRLWDSEAEDDNTLFVKRDATVVEAARAALRGADQRAGIDKLIADLDCRRYDIVLGNVVGPASTWFKGDAVLPGAFTRHCWEEQVRPRLSPSKKEGEGETWVAGARTTQTATDEELANIRSAYFRRYISEWEKFLRLVRVAAQPDMEKGVAMLVGLTDKPRPLTLILKALDDNTKLKEGTLEESVHLKDRLQQVRDTVRNKLQGTGADDVIRPREQGNDRYTPEDVGAHFAPLLQLGGLGANTPPAAAGGDAPKAMFDSYHSELERLLQGAELYRQDKDYDKLTALIQTTSTEVSGWVGRHKEDGWDLVLDTWLMPPIRSLEVAAEGDHGGGTNAGWCEAVVGPFEEIRKKFPFTDATKDADLGAVMQFFEPAKGAVWGHYENFLKKDVVHVGMHYKVKDGGASASYSKDLGPFLDKVQEITDLLFPNGPQPAAALQVQIHPAVGFQRIVFDVDGQEIQYKNEPDRWFAIKWPGEKHTGASIKAIRKDGQELIPSEGEWGLMHLLDRAKVSHNGDVLSAVWKLNTSLNTGATELQVDLKPGKLYHLFHGFQIPKSIANGPSACAGGGGGK
jgi:type VI secretion system protein ImpL